ncbi:prolyl hydroxylase family protein [Parapontixanthobacter aurantiacus]|nr:2OG-Fe(II) oxygenase [Parapontixanthobacter aurantiacus]
MKHPDQAAIARIGAKVTQRLTSDPQAYRLPTETAEIYAIGDFLTPSECARFIAMIDEVAQPSAVFEVDYASQFRTSYSGNFDPADPFVLAVSRRIDDRLGLDFEIGETIQGQRYLPGQEFKPHNDWFYTDQPYWEGEKKRGGQRSWTAMAFLNEVEEGGATHFTEARLAIDPKPGVLLIWNNALPDGSPNPGTMHAGTPVLAGEKYVLTRWYRTRKWD